eukprot:CAMPEP_0114498574 /NCGR_PEP_ID=MMETSP0109-20121206/6946_1 /TAXON_ID=29199 /ORGANISM="Chlorarachnion reptans, Strain CCCM449" /LENGTH=753 /DNA_ID=CAMNT_0001676063 /DNA_START=557 /DNA_END=2818 /DNA_ORIENTATION=-
MVEQNIRIRELASHLTQTNGKWHLVAPLLSELGRMTVTREILRETQVYKVVKDFARKSRGKLKAEATKTLKKWRKLYREEEELNVSVRLKLGGLWGKSSFEYNGVIYKLSVLKSLMQKALRRNHNCFSLCVRIVVEGVRSFLSQRKGKVSKTELTKLKSILTNLVNRLFVMGIEEGSMLMLNEHDRVKLLSTYEKAKTVSVTHTAWSDIEPLCSLLERCGPFHCRIVSYVWALGRILRRFRTQELVIRAALNQSGAPEELVRRLQNFSQDSNVQDLMKDFREGEAHSLVNSPGSIRKFATIAPKNKEFHERKMLHTGAMLLARFPQLFGKYRLPPGGQNRNPTFSLPSTVEMQGMGVIDRHCGGKKSKHYFATEGARTPNLLDDIRYAALKFPNGTHFTVDELEVIYIAEKLSLELDPNDQKVLRYRQSNNAREKHAKNAKQPIEVLTPSSRTPSMGFRQLGFKGWTLVVESALVRGFDRSFDEKVLNGVKTDESTFFLRHEIDSRLPSLHDLLANVIRIPATYNILKLSKTDYVPINRFLQVHALNSNKYEHKVLKTTSAHCERSETHLLFVQEYLKQMTKLSHLRDSDLEEHEDQIGVQLLEHMIANFLLPLTDFNATNVGFDFESKAVVRYDLMIEDDTRRALAIRKKRGFATAQRWAKRFRDILLQILNREDGGSRAATMVQRVWDNIESKAGTCELARKCLEFAGSTELGQCWKTYNKRNLANSHPDKESNTLLSILRKLLGRMNSGF